MQVLIGCGSSRENKFGGTFTKLVTLDANSDHKPDVVWNLEWLPIPFSDSSVDEIHAYDVLEHQGSQGDWEFFFCQWNDFWRVLKPGGRFCGIVPGPSSQWLWGDPSHRRAISPETMVFLDQKNYADQVGVTPMSDFRHIYFGNFRAIHMNVDADTGAFSFVLECVK